MASPLLATIKVLMKNESSNWIILLLFLGASAYLIYSGTRDIKTKEAKRRFGRILTGKWAIGYGIIKIFIGVNIVFYTGIMLFRLVAD